MFVRIFLFFFCLTVTSSLLISSENTDPLMLIDFAAQNKNTPTLPSTEGDTGTIAAGCVNVISGQYIDSALDIVTDCLEPLAIQRTYTSASTSNLDPLTGGSNAYSWNVNSNYVMLVGWSKGKGKPWASIGESGGGSYNYIYNRHRQSYEFDFNANKGITNTGGGLLSGQTNYKNCFFKELIPYPPKEFYEVKAGDGSCRYYRLAPEFQDYENLNVALLHKERKPTGNWITYNYNHTDRVVQSQSLTPNMNKVFSTLDYKWGDGNGFTIVADNARAFRYEIKRRPSGKYTSTWVIDKATYPNGLEVNYTYDLEPTRCFLTSKVLPDSRVFKIGYYREGDNHVGDTSVYLRSRDPAIGRVKFLMAPVGTTSEPKITHRFFYKHYATHVYDAHNNQTATLYDHTQRVLGVEKSCIDRSRYTFERNIWGTGDNAHQLMAKVLEDGHGKIYFARVFEYDNRGNVILEKLLGNLSGQCTQTLSYNPDGTVNENGVEAYVKRYTYFDNEFNLLRTEFDGEKITHYGYVANTNLLEAKLVGDSERTRQREFRFYNEDSALIKKIIDDGSSPHHYEMDHVTERRITYFYPRTENPALGKAERVEERYLDLQTGEEKLLKTYTNHYNGLGKIEEQKVYDAEGKFAYREVNTYDIMERIVEETDPLGQKTTFSYDINGNLIKKQGAFQTDFVYDFANRVVSETITDTVGGKRIKRFGYDLLGNRILEQDHLGNETHFTYDEFQREIKIALPPCMNEKEEAICPVTSKAYDIANHVTEHVDANGEKKLTSYNIRGQPTAHYYECHNADHMIYDLQGNLVKVISKKGVTTTFKYDYLKRPTEKTLISPDGSVIGSEIYEYDAFHLRKKCDLNGLVHQYYYDGAGREVLLISGERKLTKEYDSLGRVAAQHQWLNSDEKISTLYTYDMKDRVIEEIVQSAHGVEKREGYAYDVYGNLYQTIRYPNNQPSTTTTIYDAFKRPHMVTDALGHQTRYFYGEVVNSLNQRVEQITIINADGATTLQRLNALGFIEEVVKKDPLGTVIAKESALYDGKGHKTKEIITVLGREKPREIINRFSYAFGKLIEQVEEEEKHTRYVYNLNEELVEKSSPRSKITYQYDAFGRLASQRAFSPDEADDESFYEYDISNKLVKVSHNGLETDRSFNIYGELTAETQESGLSVEYTYDTLGRKTALILPDGTSISYSYLGSHINKISRHRKKPEENYSHTYINFDWQGNLKQSLTLTGQSITNLHDNLGRLIAIKSDAWKENEVIYDSLGNAIKINIEDSAGRSNGHFSYNALSQLTQETGASANRYAYDSMNNRTAKNKKNYQLGSCNKLLSTTDEQFTWDDDGNMLKRFGQKEALFGYDSLGHLTRYTAKKILYKYTYDSFDRRMSKSVKGYTKVRYLYDGENEIGLVDHKGNILELRVLGLSRGAEIGGAVAVELDDVVYLPIHDHRGNVCSMVSRKGKVVESYRYSAFGEIIFLNASGKVKSESKIENPWLFSSKRLDTESNLIFFGKRYYDAGIGRWITPDPKGFEDGSNLYSYVKNNPLTFFDLYGHRTEGGESEGGRGFFSSIWNTIVSAFRGAGEVVEWVGKNLIPVPGLRDGVEAIGRWAGGGKLFQRAEYHSCNSGIYRIEGTSLENKKYVHMNGVYTTLEEALAAGRKLSESLGGIEVFVIYNSTHGLLTDLLECLIAKMGIVSTPERLFAEFVKEHTQCDIIVSAHSQGGLHVSNAAQLLTQSERDRVHPFTYGSAKIIPDSVYKNAQNTISDGDYVPSVTNMYNYLMCHWGLQNNVTILNKTSNNPIKEHGFMHTTYFQQAIFEIKRCLEVNQ